MNIIYGCDCVCDCHPDGADKVPAAFVIERDGKEMRVCSHCNLSRDKYIARLFDEHSDAKTFIDYDPLGALVISALTEDGYWEDFKLRHSSKVNE